MKKIIDFFMSLFPKKEAIEVVDDMPNECAGGYEFDFESDTEEESQESKEITEMESLIVMPEVNQHRINNMLQGAGIPINRIPQNLAEKMQEYGINTIEDAKRFLANSLCETGGFRKFSESGHYTTVERLKEVFPSAFGKHGKTGKYDPKNYLKNEKKLFNLVYDDRIFPDKKLGNFKDGDGHKYKGRGSQQITGFYNYKKLFEDTGIDFVNNPEWLELDDYKFISGLSYWKTKNISSKTDLLETRKAIVGKSAHGYDEVLEWYKKLK